MKKILFSLLAAALVLCVFLFTSCDITITENPSAGTEDSENVGNTTADADKTETPDVAEMVQTFMGYINNGEYLKAIDYYNNEIYGNYTVEVSISDEVNVMLTSLNNDILNGEKTEADSKKTITVIDNVMEKTELQVDGYSELKKSIAKANASKASYLAGQELETLKNYTDAITEYKNVLETDSNYADAQAAIDRCLTTLKKDVFDKAAVLAGENNYIEAIAQLKELKKKLSDDAEVTAKLSVYEKTYINYVLTNAAEAFVTPAKDYSKALEIIHAALQHYPGNEEFLAKQTYYQSFAPVYLYDMKSMKGKADALKTDKDIYGNNYEKSFIAGYISAIWHKTDITYNLDKAYNTFSAVLYSRSTRNDVQYMLIRVYADGKIIYENLRFADNSTRPFTINLDITGVSDLRIELGQNGGAIGHGVGMTDMIVQKTVK